MLQIPNLCFWLPQFPTWQEKDIWETESHSDIQSSENSGKSTQNEHWPILWEIKVARGQKPSACAAEPAGGQAACVQLNLYPTIPPQAGLALAPLSQLKCSWWSLQTLPVPGWAAVSCPGAIPSLLVEDKHSWARFSHIVSAATRQSWYYKTLTTPVPNVSAEYSSYLLFTIF